MYCEVITTIGLASIDFMDKTKRENKKRKIKFLVRTLRIYSLQVSIPFENERVNHSVVSDSLGPHGV